MPAIKDQARIHLKEQIVAAVAGGALTANEIMGKVGVEDIVFFGLLLSELQQEGRVISDGKTPDGHWTVYRAVFLGTC